MNKAMSMRRIIAAGLMLVATSMPSLAADTVKLGMIGSVGDAPIYYALDKGYFTEAGIKLDLEQMADANLFTRARSRDFDVLLIGWGAGAPDAYSMVSRHAVNPDNRAEAKLAQYPSWRSSWQDQWINDIAEKAQMERDVAKREQMYHEIQKYMLENGPMAYICQTIRPIAYRNEVKDFVITAEDVAYWTATK